MLKRILLSASLFLVTAGAIGETYPNQPLLKRAELGLAVSTNASLKTLKSTDFTSAWRTGFYTSDDSPRVIYASTNAACTLNSGNGDDGSQVKLADGNCAIAQLAAADPDVRMWGAKCDGTTDDSAKFTAAIASAKRLRIPNKACYIKRNITLSAMLVGSPSSFAWSASPETEPYTLLVNPTATINVVRGPA